MLNKTLVFDTSVLIDNPDIFFEVDADVIIPLAVIEELDNLKTLTNATGSSARQAIRNLSAGKDSLRSGAKIGNCNVRVFIASFPPEMQNDNKILKTALLLREEIDGLTMVTSDLNMHIRADSFGLPTWLYSDKKNSFQGETIVILEQPDRIDSLYEQGDLEYDGDLLPNQYVCLQDVLGTSKSALARYDGQASVLRLLETKAMKSWIEPRNREQIFALDALLDDNIPLVTMTGLAGSGKTFLALAAGLQKVLDEQRYDKILLTRPIVPINRDIGYLPGDKDEKIIHWLAGITDNAESLLGDKNSLFMYKEKGVIELEAFTYMRGRSLNNAFIIVDEAQNMTQEEAKTILTRVGDNAKIVLMGDISQVDSRHLNQYNNGLFYAIEKFAKYDLAAHVHFIHGVRSPLSELAAQIL